MKKLIIMSLLLSASATIIPMHNFNEKIKTPLSERFPAKLLRKAVESCIKSKVNKEIAFECLFICPQENNNNQICQNKDHKMRALNFYFLELLDGLKFGVRSYLILSYFYQKGIINSSAQIGINYVSEKITKNMIIKNSNSPRGKILYNAGKLTTKYSIKYALYNCLGIPYSLVYEPCEITILAKQSIIHNGTKLTDHGIAKSGDCIFNNEYENIKENTKFIAAPMLSRGVGAAIGALIAKYFLEEKLNDLAKFASEQIKYHGPELISKIISPTK